MNIKTGCSIVTVSARSFPGYSLGTHWELYSHRIEISTQTRTPLRWAACRSSLSHNPSPRQPVVESAMGIDDGISRRADPQEKQPEKEDCSDPFNSVPP